MARRDVTDKPLGRGTVLAGRFRLEDLVQDTDGARFWRAIDQTLARSVAVNVIGVADPRSEALLSAARTSATITEGHFLRVLDAAQEDGVVYVVHEWGNGMSLEKMLAEGPLSPRRAAWLVKEVADAISFAHGHGIAHGRLVPENVMVSEAGSVKLIGFVVDAVLHGRRQPATLDGRVLSDHESDVYNLAGLLYATLVGRWPGSQESVLPGAPCEQDRILRPRQVRAGIPRPLDAVCDQVLNAGHATATLETAHEISAALSDFIGDVTVPVGHEPTMAIDRDEHARFQPAPGPAQRRTPDPEATQASAPVFDDEQARRAAPAPPPPLPEPEPRPLFAPGPPRARPDRDDDGPSGPVRASGSHHGTGSLPPVWGPDATPDPDDDSAWAGRDNSRDWLKLAAALGVVVLLVLAIVFAFNLGRGSGGDPTSRPSQEATTGEEPPRPLRVAGVTDLDPPPDGNGEENPETAPLAVDGDPATAWQTLEYYRNAQFGNLKDGVGLVVDLGRQQEVSAVQVTVQGSPTSFQVLTAPQGSSRPTDIANLRRVATADSVGGRNDLQLREPVTTQYVVVWLTSLPPEGDVYRGRIAEIVVRG
jgi:serine/threonine protein kinase